jgi:hypothetical protein
MSVGFAIAISYALGAVLMVGTVLRACWMLLCSPAALATECPSCHYPMDPRLGLRCPECGKVAPDDSELHLRRRTWRGYAIVIGAMLAGVLCTMVVPDGLRHGRWALVPSAALVRWGPSAGRAAEIELLRRLDGKTLSEANLAALLRVCEAKIVSAALADQQFGWKLLWSIARRPDERAWRVVGAALHNANPKVREATLRQINLSDPGCPDWLYAVFVDLIATDPSTPVRQRALVEFSTHTAKARDLLPAILANQPPENAEFQCLVGLLDGERAANLWLDFVRQGLK